MGLKEFANSSCGITDLVGNIMKIQLAKEELESNKKVHEAHANYYNSLAGKADRHTPASRGGGGGSGGKKLTALEKNTKAKADAIAGIAASSPATKVGGWAGGGAIPISSDQAYNQILANEGKVPGAVSPAMTNTAVRSQLMGVDPTDISTAISNAQGMGATPLSTLFRPAKAAEAPKGVLKFDRNGNPIP